MVNIKTNLNAVNNCGLTIDNVTDYKSSTNTNGFLIPTDDSIALKDYHLSDVFLFTFLVKNNWDGTFTNLPIAGNIGINVVYDPAKSFDTLMIENEVNQATSFSEDGYYSVFQLAIPKESIVANVESAATYTYYVKDDKTVWLKVTGKPDVKINVYDILNAEDSDWGNNNIVMLKSNMISKCFLEWCLSSILEVFVKNYNDPLCVRDGQVLRTLRDKRDLLFAISNTIQYYVEMGQYYQASKLIYDVSFCNICRDFILENPTVNCNCKG